MDLESKVCAAHTVDGKGGSATGCAHQRWRLLGGKWVVSRGSQHNQDSLRLFFFRVEEEEVLRRKIRKKEKKEKRTPNNKNTKATG